MNCQKHTPSLVFTHSHFEQILIAVSGALLAFLKAELGAGEGVWVGEPTFNATVQRKTRGLLPWSSELCWYPT